MTVRLTVCDSSSPCLVIHVYLTVPDGTIRREVVPGSPGFLQSPGYPNNYPANDETHWILTAPPGNRLIFSFKYLKTERSKDILQVRIAVENCSWAYFP